MRVAMFYHSLVSDWNHGNAHFLRGVASELFARGHEVRIYEPHDSWSRANLESDAGAKAVEDFERTFPRLRSVRYELSGVQPDALLDGVDLALVHEWNDPSLIAAIGRTRGSKAGLRIFFHDTHHRAVTAPHELARFDLTHYDGVLAYGNSLREAYAKRGWGKQVHVWHEAADVRTFYPRSDAEVVGDIVWVGNWGDEERTQEIRDYLIEPVRRNRWKAQVYGVRYPEYALQELNSAGMRFGGWIANFHVPDVFAQFKATVHIPRGPYTRDLPGIPTIRPFEALACGIPLVSAKWDDTEMLFRIGQDFLIASTTSEMEQHLAAVLHDADLRESLKASGLETIRSRHTCGHRVEELLRIFSITAPATAMCETELSTGVVQ